MNQQTRMVLSVIRQLAVLFVVMTVLALSFASVSGAQDMEEKSALSARQDSLVIISALTATGDIEALKKALNQALNRGLTVNEVEEVIVHVYAYAGFPRSFNGMMAFMAVMKERQARGIKDEMGREASPLPADLDRDAYGARVRAQLGGHDEVPPLAPWQKFSPVIDKFLKEHLFADLFARDILTFQDRELATIAVLASLPGLEGPLRFHFSAAMNTGLTDAQLKDFVTVIKAEIGAKQAEMAQQVLEDVLLARAN
ncbi:MAG: carboxymuconolactone decarboxylase family protein [Alphaproteobacteria bacterium]|nr:carboxymuconolactone decarboxylase family protein [Alphaproteobacteria bacterium]